MLVCCVLFCGKHQVPAPQRILPQGVSGTRSHLVVLLPSRNQPYPAHRYTVVQPAIPHTQLVDFLKRKPQTLIISLCIVINTSSTPATHHSTHYRSHLQVIRSVRIGSRCPFSLLLLVPVLYVFDAVYYLWTHHQIGPNQTRLTQNSDDYLNLCGSCVLRHHRGYFSPHQQSFLYHFSCCNGFVYHSTCYDQQPTQFKQYSSDPPNAL